MPETSLNWEEIEKHATFQKNESSSRNFPRMHFIDETLEYVRAFLNRELITEYTAQSKSLNYAKK